MLQEPKGDTEKPVEARSPTLGNPETHASPHALSFQSWTKPKPVRFASAASRAQAWIHFVHSGCWPGRPLEDETKASVPRRAAPTGTSCVAHEKVSQLLRRTAHSSFFRNSGQPLELQSSRPVVVLAPFLDEPSTHGLLHIAAAHFNMAFASSPCVSKQKRFLASQ